MHINVVYQQYISDKNHVHMNATCWVTLTSYVRHLGRTGQCEIDETEKGWFITWIKKDPEEEEREKEGRGSVVKLDVSRGRRMRRGGNLEGRCPPDPEIPWGTLPTQDPP